MTDWVMPEPTLDDDDRFQVCMIYPEDPSDPAVYLAMIGPSGYGCMYCGGPYDGLIAVAAHNARGRPAKIAACLTHKDFCIGMVQARLAVLDDE